MSFSKNPKIQLKHVMQNLNNSPLGDIQLDHKQAVEFSRMLEDWKTTTYVDLAKEIEKQNKHNKWFTEAIKDKLQIRD